MDKLNDLYKKQGFFDLYNGSVFWTVTALISFFLIFAYFYIRSRLGPIRANWNSERCSPVVIPFAGLINAPRGTSKFEYTFKNFNICINKIIKETVKIGMEPIQALTNIIQKFFGLIVDAIDATREVISVIRTGVADVSRSIMQRLLLVLIPFQVLVIKVKTVMGKAHSVLTSGMYTAFGAYFTVLSSLQLIFDFLMALLAALSAMLIVLWADPFTWAEAAIYSAAYTAAAIPIGLIGGAIDFIVSLSGQSNCFKKGTLLRGSNNTLYDIASIPLGTELMRCGKVTSVMKLSAKGQTMYKLDSVTVSGDHIVKYKKEWIKVSEHPDAVKDETFNDKFIYCITTSRKKIIVDNHQFLDWDDLDERKVTKLNCDNGYEVFEKYENGFIPSTLVETIDGSLVRMEDLEVDSLLKGGERVTGVIKIMPKTNLAKFQDFIGTSGLAKIQELGLYTYDIDIDKPEYLIHLLTDKGKFMIGKTQVFDYNKNIDYYL